MSGIVLRHGSLFSGIGGFDLAADWTGWENIFHCEIDPFCRRVLDFYWPKAESYEDIRQMPGAAFRRRVDIITGGFPCQPFSHAGKRRGTADDRYLWPAMFRIIQQVRPRWVVAENVSGIVSWQEGLVLRQVYADLEAEGYQVLSFLIPAAGVGAPHRRERLWIIAHAPCKGYGCNHKPGNNRPAQAADKSDGNQRQWFRDEPGRICPAGNAANTGGQRGGLAGPGNYRQARKSADCHIPIRVQHEDRETNSQEAVLPPENGASADADLRERRQGWLHAQKPRLAAGYLGPQHTWDGRTAWRDFPSESPLRGGDDGLSELLAGITLPRFYKECLKGYGNAIVPQVALMIFAAINEYENRNQKY